VTAKPHKAVSHKVKTRPKSVNIKCVVAECPNYTKDKTGLCHQHRVRRGTKIRNKK
jgi:hypothetical protein